MMMTDPTVKLYLGPTVTVFVRHNRKCPYQGDAHPRCNCWKHLRWFEKGKPKTETTKSTKWEGAERARRKKEIELDPSHVPAQPKAMTITVGVESLIKKKEGKNLRKPTLRKWRHELSVLENFMATRGRFLVSEIEPGDLIDFRATWAQTWKSGLTRQRTQQSYRGFLNHVCHDAQRLKLLKDTLDPIKLQQPDKLRLKPQPFCEAELRKLLVNVPVVFASNLPMIAKMTALIHCQTATGLSISDALQLEPRHMEDGWLKIYRQKTDKIAKQRVDPALRQELLEVGKDNQRYIFWDGQRKRKTREPDAGTASGILQGAALINQTLLFESRLRTLMKKSGLYIKGNLSHRFRDTAVDFWLGAGWTLEEVADALGDTVAIVEKHYKEAASNQLEERIAKLPIRSW
jgi:site-specific recombinase XerD